MADTDGPDEQAPGENVMGNLPSTRPGRRSTRRTAADAEDAGSGSATAGPRSAAAKTRAAGTGSAASKAKAPAKPRAASAKTTTAKPKATTAKTTPAKPKATTAKTTPAKPKATTAKTTPAKPKATTAKTTPAKPKATTAKTIPAKPKATAAKPKRVPATASSGTSAARGTRRTPATDEETTPPVATAPAPRSGWATPESADDARTGGGLSVAGLVGGATKQGVELAGEAAKTGEKLVRGVLKRLGRS
ncbi:hypothetical protein [Patulibacter minatonensis]|uniref:hypothetical protein n=1 Tax=Patulibacter minatonensis TaxID=298163 RepID=UPI000478F5C9|nr:hypothetical protein [Patulibacter minatonensis]